VTISAFKYNTTMSNSTNISKSNAISDSRASNFTH